MTDLDLRSFAARSRALVDSSPPTTSRETRAWLVDPLLEALGWDVHADACLSDRSVDGTRFEYVCTVESIPALFVAVDPYPSSLSNDRASAICQTMAWTGVDRALYTNGRRLVVLAGTTDVDHSTCPLTAVDDDESTLVHYTRDRLARRLERHSREHVARQLALDRAALVDSIVDRLTAVGGETYESEFESATDRFLERLVASFASGATPLPASDEEDDGVSIQFTDPAAGVTDPGDRDAGPPTESAGGGAADASADERASDATDANRVDGADVPTAGHEDARDDDADPESVEPAGESATEDATGDGEYVVRFFNDRGSIGALGHSTSERALVHAAEYCFDRGLSGISVPWGPDDGAETVLNDRPVHADGGPMAASEQLSNGLSLNTAGSVDDHADRVKALASRAGLRAMLTGDWESDR